MLYIYCGNEIGMVEILCSSALGKSTLILHAKYLCAQHTNITYTEMSDGEFVNSPQISENSITSPQRERKSENVRDGKIRMGQRTMRKSAMVSSVCDRLVPFSRH